MNNTTEPEAYPKPTELGEIGVDRRLAIHEADAKHKPLMEKSSDACVAACAELGRFVWETPNIDPEDAEFRRLLDGVNKRMDDAGEDYIALQAEHEEIEHKYDKMTAEYFAKNPIANNDGNGTNQ
jgi:hypothetical protein